MSPGGPLTAALVASSYRLFLEALPLVANAQGAFLSPVSILFALALALNGAGPSSPTHAELLGVISGAQPAPSEASLNSELGRAMTLLSAPGGEDASFMLVANSLWTNRGTQLKAEYVEQMKTIFQATAGPGGAADVNAWVSQATRGMITQLLQSDDFDAVLANAIYFKGLWSHAFEKELTSERDFKTGAGATKAVPMMHREFEGPDRVPLARKQGVYEAVELPYKGDTFTAIALLPAEGVEVAVALKDFAAAPETFQLASRTKIILPKFKVSSQMSLTPVLRHLGVKSAFGGSADFSRLSASGLHISDVVHKAVVEVDEEGTVAAAATGVIMLTSLEIPSPPFELVFDRPFAFIIHHKPTGLPAFVGVVSDPSE
ncbi:hypothetical protein HYH03_000115 [Edaphochlamys debaryana]|uniref:Serpin domain-containing protein n=1 Tax=Edaphochlamys debaryana TaxID=47281 RepID=A0A836C672_9CHLO|nr:hypothetical protein HYH03_000115 [Edaphochlamys debaryana]|eukprot:KAG2501610.1 hypothetical protein HYH03_000115 [Edaphochlamys debaryana]